MGVFFDWTCENFQLALHERKPNDGSKLTMIAADDNNHSNSDKQEEAKRTVGEELFLVHLNRASTAEPDPADFDRDKKEGTTGATPKGKSTKKKGGKSSASSSSSSDEALHTPGEELWKVHCKRFKGSDDDEDTIDRADRKRQGVHIEEGKDTARDDGRVLHLRNRDVALS
jgi:hypothetical protein